MIQAKKIILVEMVFFFSLLIRSSSDMPEVQKYEKQQGLTGLNKKTFQNYSKAQAKLLFSIQTDLSEPYNRFVASGHMMASLSFLKKASFLHIKPATPVFSLTGNTKSLSMGYKKV